MSSQPTPSPNPDKEVPDTGDIPDSDMEGGKMPTTRRKKRNNGKRDDS